MKPVVVVSGLPRCGTSMMMAMVEAGGIPVLADGVRVADEDNPKGYYEFERVKALREDKSWVPQARGMVVKMVSALLTELPADETYRVVFMERDMAEMVASQSVMRQRKGDPDPLPEADRIALFERHLAQVYQWADGAAHLSLLRVRYNDLLAEPAPHAERVAGFLGGGLDVAAMIAVVDRSLYRQRA